MSEPFIGTGKSLAWKPIGCPASRRITVKENILACCRDQSWAHLISTCWRGQHSPWFAIHLIAILIQAPGLGKVAVLTAAMANYDGLELNMQLYLVDSQESEVEFTQPPPPKSGFHTIEAPPIRQQDFVWKPSTSTSHMAPPVEPSGVRVTLDEKFLAAVDPLCRIVGLTNSITSKLSSNIISWYNLWLEPGSNGPAVPNYKLKYNLPYLGMS